MDEYVEKKVPPICAPLPGADCNQPRPWFDVDPFECRLENWARVARNNKGLGGNVCAGWARIYIGIRNQEAAMQAETNAPDIPPDQFDGWAIEHAVGKLPLADAELLRDYYVHRQSIDRIRRARPGKRGREIREALMNAKNNLRLMLTKASQSLHL